MGGCGHRSKGLLLALLLVASLAQGLPGDDGGGDDRHFGPMDAPTSWADSLDDMGRVYVPTGGLVGVEVSGGDAHLKAGSNNGWIASEVRSTRP